MRRPISSMTDEEIKTLYKILGFENTHESSPEYRKLYESIKNNNIIIPESSYSIDEIEKMIDWLDSNYFDRGKDVNYINPEISKLLKEKGCDCLNIYEVCKWIRKNYGLYIYATYEEDRGFQPNIKSLITGELYITGMYNGYEDPEPVLEEAIKYCLEESQQETPLFPFRGWDELLFFNIKNLKSIICVLNDIKFLLIYK